MNDVRSMSPQQLEALLAPWGQPPYRARQLFGWLHRRCARSFDEMSDLPASLRAALSETCFVDAITECRRQTSRDGTIKFLFALRDGNTVETVLMGHSYGNSLCVSTQVGCAMGCAFCASGLGGRVRNLTAGEMLLQLDEASRLTGRSVDSVVLMGMGEPLDNFDNLLRFLELVHHPDGRNLSHRHISLSTCGLVDRILELAEYQLQLTLSVSLHAADNKTRDRIMPINKKYPLEVLMAACRRYFAQTGRRISYEYALVQGINDSPRQAEALVALLQGQTCHVNLIFVNPVAGRGFTRTERAPAEAFLDVLTSHGLAATIRRELGTDINAACGQLRRNDAKGEATCG